MRDAVKAHRGGYLYNVRQHQAPSNFGSSLLSAHLSKNVLAPGVAVLMGLAGIGLQRGGSDGATMLPLWRGGEVFEERRFFFTGRSGEVEEPVESNLRIGGRVRLGAFELIRIQREGVRRGDLGR